MIKIIILLLLSIHHFILRIFKHLDLPGIFIFFLREVSQLKKRFKVEPRVEISYHRSKIGIVTQVNKPFDFVTLKRTPETFFRALCILCIYFLFYVHILFVNDALIYIFDVSVLRVWKGAWNLIISSRHRGKLYVHTDETFTAK